MLNPLTDERLSNTSTDMEALGSIEIRIYRATFIGRVKRGYEYTPLVIEDIGSVNERSKKAGAHCVK